MQQSTIDWVVYKLQNVFLKVLEIGSLRSSVNMVGFWGGLSLGLQITDSSFPPLSAYGGKRAGQLSGLFLKGTNSIHKGSTPMTRLPPKGLTSKYHHIEC